MTNAKQTAGAENISRWEPCTDGKDAGMKVTAGGGWIFAAHVEPIIASLQSENARLTSTVNLLRGELKAAQANRDKFLSEAEESRDTNMRLTSRVEALTRAAEWISVSERLPVPAKVVIVHGGIAYWREGEWFTLTACDWPGKRIKWKVEHWQSLPEPPAAPASAPLPAPPDKQREGQ